MKRDKLVSVKRTSPDTTTELLSSEQLPAATPEHSEGHQEASNALNASVARTQGIRAPIDAAVRTLIAERLEQNPLASHTEIAAELGVSHDFVGQVARRLNGTEPDLGDKRAKSYQRQIGKALPVSERVMIYADVARGKGDPKASFSKLGALKRLEELEGIVTRKEQREVADNSVPNLPAMFVMPANTDVDIGVAIKVRTRK